MMSTQTDNGKGSQQRDGYDRHDINVRFVAVMTFVVVAVIAVSVFALYEYFVYEKERQIYEQTLQPESTKLIELRARETELLTTYGVNDSVYGILRIPIDSAIEQMAAKAVNSAAGAKGKR
jgi:hypothetical protein